MNPRHDANNDLKREPKSPNSNPREAIGEVVLIAMGVRVVVVITMCTTVDVVQAIQRVRSFD